MQKTTFKKASEIPVNQTEHEKKSKESRCYLEVGERTGCPHNLLADWSQKKEKKTHIYREVGNNKNSTHENRNMLKPM